MGFSPCKGASCTKCIAHIWFRTLSKQDWYTYLAEKKAQGLKSLREICIYVLYQGTASAVP